LLDPQTQSCTSGYLHVATLVPRVYLLYSLRLIYTKSYNNGYTSHHLIGVFLSDPPTQLCSHASSSNHTIHFSPFRIALHQRLNTVKSLARRAPLDRVTTRHTLHSPHSRSSHHCQHSRRLLMATLASTKQHPSSRISLQSACTRIRAFSVPSSVSKDAGDPLSLSLAAASERKGRESGLVGCRAARGRCPLLQYIKVIAVPSPSMHVWS